MRDQGVKVGAVIVARCSSLRFANKAMTRLADRLLIDHVIDRARQIRRANDLVLATSQMASDDKLAEHALRRGVGVFRGSLQNVAYRVLCCARCRGLSHVVRINGDCPFVDPTLIDKGIAALIGSRLDMVTNVLPRTFPYGVSVEAMSAEALARAYDRMTDAADFEHVSRVFYRRREDFRIFNMHNPAGDWSSVHLAVDQPEHLKRIESIIGMLSTSPQAATTRQLVDAYLALESIRQRETVGAQ